MGMVQKLAHSNEQAWIAIGAWRVTACAVTAYLAHPSISLPSPPGSAAEAMEDYERAIAAYESSLRHNPYSVPAMNAIAGVHRTMDRFEKVSNRPEDGSSDTSLTTRHCARPSTTFSECSTSFQRMARRGAQWATAIS